jgi:hypothetical protein
MNQKDNHYFEKSLKIFGGTLSMICLKCARIKIKGNTTKPCGDCIILNVDPFAEIRANVARPSRLLNFSFEAAVGGSSGWTAQKPPRAKRGGYSL